MTTECALVIGIVLIFQVLDIIQMRSIKSVVEDIINHINNN